ncbi:hypothetical protein HDU84_006332 [Entophlyctis sp. JEL0112]|nr:hypothetical protein HDU84_006332 [Entophlyctis sp. JEL0112]
MDSDLTEVPIPPCLPCQSLIIHALSSRESFEALRDVAASNPARISHVVSVLKDPPDFLPPHIVHLSIPIDDQCFENALSYFDSAYAFIAKALAHSTENAVLIHCLAGMSRSPTFAAAYLMKTNELTTSEVLELIRQRRPKAWFVQTKNKAN